MEKNKHLLATALSIAITLLASADSASADVRLPKVFTDHMVLQQGKPIAVWGWADKGENVTASIGGKTASATANDAGKWRVDLPALKADGGKAQVLSIKGNNRIEFKDVLIGEVWLASGQSNMNRPVGGDAIEAAAHPHLRLFTTNGNIPREDTLNETVGWEPCSPQSIGSVGPMVGNRQRAFSEVAYHFGEKLHAELKVPIGIIHTSIGGSTAKDWTPNPDIAGQFPFGEEPGDIRHKFGIGYQARIAGLVPYTIKGVIWYQGEDDGRNKKYAADMKALIASWRGLWSDGTLPFYMVQIAQTTYASGMLGVWEAQQEVVKSVPHTGIAVSNDIYEGTNNGGFKIRTDKTVALPIAGGSNPHPTGRPVVARRLADIALAKIYNRLDREVSGPSYASHEIVGNKIIVTFKNVGAGLKVVEGEELKWFEISDGSQTDERPIAPLVYLPAEAKLAGKDKIEISSEAIAKPAYARFSWHALARHYLVNSENLSALPFRTNDLPQMWNRR
jgi:sialate O-acetylesterase